MSEQMTLQEALKEKGIVGDYVPMRELLGTKVMVTRIQETEGRFGKTLAIAFLQDGQEKRTLTQSPAIVEKLTAVEDMLPLYATFVSKESPRTHRHYYDAE